MRSAQKPWLLTAFVVATAQHVNVGIRPADPCFGSADVQRCQFEQALTYLSQVLAKSERVLGPPAPQGPVEQIGTAQTPVRDPRCPQYFSSAECTRFHRLTALRWALEALEGQPPVPAILDGVLGDLEVAMEEVRPGALLEFRRAHLSRAFSAGQMPLTSVPQRAAAAVGALESTPWPTTSRVPRVLEALRWLTGPLSHLQGSGGAAPPPPGLPQHGGGPPVAPAWLPQGGGRPSPPASTLLQGGGSTPTAFPELPQGRGTPSSTRPSLWQRLSSMVASWFSRGSTNGTGASP
mmetsp:Transcript_113943/g.317296  ORF Transcript_113943/g.317296 Transcript_113943/m.317296 type:complete len:293 (-) Transcript_113943:66-944(-)